MNGANGRTNDIKLYDPGLYVIFVLYQQCSHNDNNKLFYLSGMKYENWSYTILDEFIMSVNTKDEQYYC